MNGAEIDPPTICDLAEYGPETCLAVMREVHQAVHARWPQYRGCERDMTLGVMVARVDKDGTSFTRAEVGDLVLIWHTPYPRTDGCVTVYAPRVGWHVLVEDYEVWDAPVSVLLELGARS